MRQPQFPGGSCVISTRRHGGVALWTQRRKVALWRHRRLHGVLAMPIRCASTEPHRLAEWRVRPLPRLDHPAVCVLVEMSSHCPLHCAGSDPWPDLHGSTRACARLPSRQGQAVPHVLPLFRCETFCISLSTLCLCSWCIVKYDVKYRSTTLNVHAVTRDPVDRTVHTRTAIRCGTSARIHNAF